MQHTGEPPIDDVDAALEAINAYPDFDTHGYGRWACVLKEHGVDSAPIGFCGLKFLDDMGEVDVGYRFLPDYWGRGLATESTRVCVDFGFTTLGLDHVCAFVLAANRGSIRVLEKVGMKRAADVVYDGQAAQRWVLTRADWGFARQGRAELQP